MQIRSLKYVSTRIAKMKNMNISNVYEDIEKMGLLLVKT